MKKEDQHIDKLFQGLKDDSFVAPQSFMDDLKLRVDARAKLAVRRKFTLWFILLSIVLIAIASIIIYTLPKNTVSELHKQISVGEISNAVNADSNSLKNQNQNQKSALVSDATISNTEKVGNKMDNDNSTEEENNIVATENGNLKNTEQLSKKEVISKQNKNRISPNVELANEKLSANRNSKTTTITTKKGKEGNGQKANNASNKTFIATVNKSKSTGEQNINQKNNLSTSVIEQTNNELIGLEQGAFEDEKSQPSYRNGVSVQNDFNKRDVVLKMKAKQEIANPFNLSLEENESLLTNSNLVPVKVSKKLEFNLEAYGGALITSTKYNPVPSADGFTSSAIISPSFGLKTSLLHQNIYGSVGVDYFKTGDKQTFNTNTFSQVGIDSVQTVTYFDTVWIDTMTFYIDSVISYQITPIIDSITNSNKITNQYTWISIPLSFGYRFQFNSWDVIPNVGVNLNFGIGKNSGQYPDASNQLVKYDALKFNMDIRIQTEVRKNFGKYYVFVSPYFRKNLKPIISNPSLRLTQNNWGLNAGFGVKF